MNSCNTTGTSMRCVWCAKIQYCTHTYITCFGNTMGIPIPVWNPTHRPENGLLDCFTHTSNWLQHLSNVLQCPLDKSDYLFSGLASTGQLKFRSAVTHADIEQLLDFCTARAGLLETHWGKFMTHCFWWGGAQWHFMWQPGQKWSLKTVKWWGGWAPSESVSPFISSALVSWCVWFTRLEHWQHTFSMRCANMSMGTVTY